MTHDDYVTELCKDEYYISGTTANLDAITSQILRWVQEAKAEAWAEGASDGWESSGEGWNGEYPGYAFDNDIPNPYRASEDVN